MIKEFEKIVMDSYDKGVTDTKEAALEIVKEAVLAERESCAKILEADADARGECLTAFVLRKNAIQIRARGEK